VWYGADEYIVAGLDLNAKKYKLEPVADTGDPVEAEKNSIWVDAADIDK
jgi:hypothetical protein